MIKKVEVKNFKSIGDPGIEIEFKPITLLFGPNSSGKSSVIQALHYALEVLNRNYEPSETRWGGSAINFNNFQNIVHNQDNEKIITLGFHFHYGGDDMPGVYEDDFYPEHENEYENEFTDRDLEEAKELKEHYSLERLCDSVDSANVFIEIAYNSTINSARVINYKLAVDDIDFATIKLEDYNPKNTYTFFSYLNLDHPALEDRNRNDEPRGSFFRAVTQTNSETFELKIAQSTHAVPLKRLNIDAQHLEFYDYGISDPNNLPFFYHNYKYLLRLVCRSIVSITEELRYRLSELLYLGPLRELPARNYSPVVPLRKERWYNGLTAWDALYSYPDLVEKTNKWMKKLKMPYHLRRYNVIELADEQLASLRSSVYRNEEVMTKIIDAFDLYSKGEELNKTNLIKKLYEIVLDEKKQYPQGLLKSIRDKIYVNDDKGNRLSPYDVGTGISQVLPVIVAVLFHNDLLAIEQPELHIHPALQVELADLFIRKVNPPPGTVRLSFPTIIIETHSEHIMLRLLRRIEESNKKDLPDYPLYPKDLNVYWCEPGANGLKAELLPIDETGEFTRQWPQGFFEERREELFPDE